MGLIRQNPFGGDWEGMFGNMVFAKYKPGIKIGRKRPVRTKPPTEAEKANQAEFRQAVVWAKAVWAHQPELKAKYNATARLKYGRGFQLAKSDFLRPPVVEEIDLSGYTGKPNEAIRVRAVDVFEVASVGLKIRDLAGVILEEGEAVLDNGSWLYHAKLEVPAGQTVVIEARATDHPGHTGVKKADHACGPRA